MKVEDYTLEDGTPWRLFTPATAQDGWAVLWLQGFTKIIVIGGSFDGYMAALLADERRPEAVALRAPANYDDAEFDYPYAQTTKRDNAYCIVKQSMSRIPIEPSTPCGRLKAQATSSNMKTTRSSLPTYLSRTTMRLDMAAT